MNAPSHSLLRYLRQANRNVLHRVGRPNGRSFTTTPVAPSGHSKWATIKHDKALADTRRHKARLLLSDNIVTAVKIYGSPDPSFNPRLRDAIAFAKRQGLPKDVIENAIKRGQGLSVSGKPLETVTVDAVFPSGIAAIIECSTESKAKTLMEVRHILTKHNANASPVQYLFKRQGSVVIKPLKEELSEEKLMESCLEVEGFEDLVEGEEGKIELLTEEKATKAVADAVEQLGAEVEGLNIRWQPLDYVEAPAEDVERIDSATIKLEELQEVQNIYMNLSRTPVDADAAEPAAATA